jgi:hypothetical protein
MAGRLSYINWNINEKGPEKPLNFRLSKAFSKAILNLAKQDF